MSPEALINVGLNNGWHKLTPKYRVSNDRLRATKYFMTMENHIKLSPEEDSFSIHGKPLERDSALIDGPAKWKMAAYSVVFQQLFY